MSAATKNRLNDASRSAGDVVEYAGASGVHIYSGTLVLENTEGYVKPASTNGNTATDRFVGVAWDEMDNSSTNSSLSSVSNGALDCRVYKSGVFTFVAQGTPSASDVGEVAYAVDDQTVGNSHAEAITVGNIVGYDSSNYRVRIDKYVDSVAGVSGYWRNEGTGSAY